MEVWLLFVILKKWLSISLFIKKNSACLLLLKKKTECLGFLAYLLFYCTFCMSTSFFIKKNLNALDSWHIYCFIIQVTFMFFSFFVFRTREWCCINVRTCHVHTNTYWSWWLKIALCSLDGWYWWWHRVLLVSILTTTWHIDMYTFWYV